MKFRRTFKAMVSEATGLKRQRLHKWCSAPQDSSLFITTQPNVICTCYT